MEKLYERYGQLMIQLEILNGQIQEVKQAIANEMNKPKVPVKADKKEDKKVEEKKG